MTHLSWEILPCLIVWNYFDVDLTDEMTEYDQTASRLKTEIDFKDVPGNFGQNMPSFSDVELLNSWPKIDLV